MDNNLVVLVDFDYTLFDTEKFVQFLSSSPNSVDYKNFLFPDALPFIEYASKFADLTLFSEGELEFQEEKVEGTGIDELFLGGVKILPSFTKIDELTKIGSGKNVILIDDKPDIVDEAVSLGFKVIRVKRGKYAKSETKSKPSFVVGSLSEIVEKDLLRNF